jgi:hypothetical protein
MSRLKILLISLCFITRYLLSLGSSSPRTVTVGVDRFRNLVFCAMCRSVLEELRTLWEQNILKSGVIGKDEVEENPPQG